jgi:hypothetical protein
MVLRIRSGENDHYGLMAMHGGLYMGTFTYHFIIPEYVVIV